MVGQEHRLGALEVGVAGHPPVGVRARRFEQPRHQCGGQLAGTLGVAADVERQVGRDLVVARPPGVELAADRPDQLGEPALDRHMDVLVRAVEDELVPLELGGDLVEPGEQPVALLLVDHPGPGERPDVGLRATDVLGPEAPVEGERRVQPPEERVLRAFEP
jgi:hypothetical protein